MSPGRLKLSLILATLLVLAGGFFISSQRALAAPGINKYINFQGKVVNTNGTNVANGPYDFVFKIYNNTTLVWTETRTGGNQVTVTDGIFQVNLGSVQALPGSVNFNTDNVNLGVEFASNGEMTPRIQFTAAPYAFNADNLDGGEWGTPGTIGSTSPNTAAFTSLTTTLAATIGAAATYDPIVISPVAKGTTSYTGTISSLDLTGNHAWNFPNVDGTVALTANKLSDFAATTSLELLGNISDETGTGKLTFATSPTFLTGVTLGDSSGATFVLTSALSGATDPTLTFGNDLITTSGDLKITGDDLFMNTNTSGYVLVADGANFNPVLMSGDVSIGTGGVTAIGANKVTGSMIALTSDAAGDIMYYNGTDYARLAGSGTTDWVLKYNLAGNAPYWGAAAGGAQTPWAQNVDAANYILSNIGNAGTDFIASTGALTLAGVLTANGGVSMGTQTLSGTTGIINYTGFDVDAAGNLDALGTLTAGSGNVQVTDAAGKVQHDSIVDCADTQVLKWATAGGWYCGTDATGAGGDAGYGLEAVAAVATNGTWTRPGTYVTNVFVEVWGAGAGGLAANSNNSMGGGGGGEYRAGIVAVSGNVNVVVGTGGAANTNGTNSTFPGTTTIDAKGGTRPTTITGGAGGTGGSGGTVALNGQAGGNGMAGDGGKSGAGGSAARGGAGGKEAGGANAGNTNKAGGAGQVPGGGGGGGAECTGAAGVGAAGYVVVWGLSGTNGSDLAEIYETKSDVEVGDVVSMSQDSFNYNSEWGLQDISILEKAQPESRIVGVVSTQVAITMGKKISETAKNPLPIALSGRTPVKVSLENGPIKTGDLLGPSSIPGVAAKTEKAGMIIGAALEDYVPPLGGSIGKVMIFVNTEYSSGARTNVLLKKAGFDPDNIPAGVDIGRIMLAQTLLDKKNITAETPLSEILTDRVVAGLEIISPRVLTDTLAANSIEPAEKDLKIKFLADGKLVIERIGQEALSATFGGSAPIAGTTVMSIDAFGNADFAGTITADSIAANKIVGLEIYTDKISGIDESVDALTDKLNTLQTAQESIDLSSLGILEKKGGLTIAKETTFKEATIFEKLVTLVGNVIFRGNVSFEKTPTFNSDTAGYAVIKEKADSVVITFEKEYAAPPVINASLSLQQIEDADLRKASEDLLLISDARFIITNATTKSFEIKIGQPAVSDIPFSWQALAVKDAKTFISKDVSVETGQPEIPAILPENALPDETIPPENLSSENPPETIPIPDSVQSDTPADTTISGAAVSSVLANPTENNPI